MKTHAIVDIPVIGSCDIEQFEGQPFIVSRKNKFIGRTAEGWMHVYNVPDFARPRGTSLIEDECIQMLTAQNGMGIHTQLIATCDKVKDQKPLFAFRVAVRAMHTLSNELKTETQDLGAPKLWRETRLQFWNEVFRTESRMADWVDSILLGETVSIRHPTHSPNSSAEALRDLREMIQKSLVIHESHEQKLLTHDEQLRIVQNPLHRLSVLIEPCTSLDAIYAYGLNPDGDVPGSRLTVDQHLGAILARRWIGDPLPKRRNRKPNQSYEFAPLCRTYSMQHILDCFPEFLSSIGYGVNGP